jgi:hypothetical protein
MGRPSGRSQAGRVPAAGSRVRGVQGGELPRVGRRRPSLRSRDRVPKGTGSRAPGRHPGGLGWCGVPERPEVAGPSGAGPGVEVSSPVPLRRVGSPAGPVQNRGVARWLGSQRGAAGVWRRSDDRAKISRGTVLPAAPLRSGAVAANVPDDQPRNRRPPAVTGARSESIGPLGGEAHDQRNPGSAERILEVGR